MTASGTYLVSASYDLTISVTDISSDTRASGCTRYALQNAQANRIIPFQQTKFIVATNPTILVFDKGVKSNKAIQTFQAHQTNVTDICTDGTRLFSCSEDKHWRLWDFAHNRPVASYNTGTCLNTLCLLHNNTVLMTGNDKGQLSTWSVEDGSEITTVRIAPCSIRSIDKVTDDTALVACLDGRVVLVSVGTNDITEVRRFQPHQAIVTRVAVSPDKKLFATSSQDSTAKIWRVDDFSEAIVLQAEMTHWIWDVVFSADSKRVCTGGTDKICRVFNVDSGVLQRTIEWHQKGVSCITLLE